MQAACEELVALRGGSAGAAHSFGCVRGPNALAVLVAAIAHVPVQAGATGVLHLGAGSAVEGDARGSGSAAYGAKNGSTNGDGRPQSINVFSTGLEHSFQSDMPLRAVLQGSDSGSRISIGDAVQSIEDHHKAGPGVGGSIGPSGKHVSDV